MSNMTIREQIQKEIAKSRQMRNPSRFFYYSKMAEDGVSVALPSWEQFRESWAHAIWTSKHQHEIQSMIDSDNHRFPWNPWKSV